MKKTRWDHKCPTKESLLMKWDTIQKKKIKSKLEFKKKVKLKNNKSLQTVKIMDGKGVI